MVGFDTVDIGALPEMDEAEVGFVRSLVEGLFGPCHPNVEIGGVYFYDRRHPTSIYPMPYSQFRVSVCLPGHQADNPLARLVHLSHELVHCLTPNGMPPGQATVLEEGLCEHAKVYLADELFRDEYPDFDFTSLPTGNYIDAFRAVEELIEAVGLEQMRAGVRSLRQNTGLPFSRITVDHLQNEFPDADRSLLDRLSRRFH